MGGYPWDIFVQQIRSEIGETVENFFIDQDIKRTAHIYQNEIATACGGVDEDISVFFDFLTGEKSLPTRCLKFKQVYRNVAGNKTELDIRNERPMSFGTVLTGAPYECYFLRKAAPDGGILGLNPTPTDGNTCTGTLSSSVITVTGVGTLFTTELAVGQYIKSNGQTRIVKSITSNTVLVTTVAFLPALSTNTFVSGERIDLLAKSTTLLYGLRIYHTGASVSDATAQVTATGITLTKTTGGVPTATPLTFAANPTYSEMVTAINAVSGYSADTPHDTLDTIRDLEPTIEISVRQKYIEFYDGMKLDIALVPTMKLPITATMRRRDNQEVRARSEMDEYRANLRRMRTEEKAQRRPGSRAVEDYYAGARYGCSPSTNQRIIDGS